MSEVASGATVVTLLHDGAGSSTANRFRGQEVHQSSSGFPTELKDFSFARLVLGCRRRSVFLDRPISATISIHNFSRTSRAKETEAEAKAALAYNEFLAKVARLALRAMNGDLGNASRLHER
jgi:hypothetical protein